MPHRFLLALALVCLLGIPGRTPADAQAAPWQSAWPMVGHDPQRTNRSEATVARHLTLLFSRRRFYGPPVVGVDGTMYGWSDGGLKAIGPSGAARWTYRAWPGLGGPPVLAPNGVLYAAGLTSSEISVPHAAIFGVGRDGRLVEKVQPSAFSKGSPPAATEDGTVYVPYVGPTELYAGLTVMRAGKRPRLLQHGFTFADVAIGPSGGVYALGRYSSHEDGLSVERLTPTGKILWRHPIGYDGNSVMVGLHGRVYVAGGVAVGAGSTPYTQISAYTSRGRLLWRHRPVMGLTVLGQRSDGAIVAAGQTALAVYATDGTKLWSVPLGRSMLDAGPSLALDAGDTALVGCGDGRIRIVSPDGALLDTLDGGPASTRAAPEVAIGADGRVIATGTDGVLRVYR